MARWKGREGGWRAGDRPPQEGAGLAAAVGRGGRGRPPWRGGRGGREDGEGDDMWDPQQGHFSLFTVPSLLSG